MQEGVRDDARGGGIPPVLHDGGGEEVQDGVALGGDGEDRVVVLLGEVGGGDAPNVFC